jgi:hypothetical protein
MCRQINCRCWLSEVIPRAQPAPTLVPKSSRRTLPHLKMLKDMPYLAVRAAQARKVDEAVSRLVGLDAALGN